MSKWLERVMALIVAGMFMASVGCEGGGGDDGGGDPADGPSMTGVWTGTYGSGSGFSMSITQSGDALTGSYTEGAISGTLSGSVNGNNVAFTVTLTSGGSAVADFTGNVNDARSSMSGSFNIISGGGGNGSWSASK